MKLLYSKTSPYSRKVRLVVEEKGLQEHIELVPCDPFVENPQLKAANPLGKIPTLIRDDGSSLFDSPVICRYLDQLGGASIIPTDSEKHWATLRWEALADGLLDAAYNTVVERKRQESEQSAEWLGTWAADIHRSLDEIENNISSLGDEVTLAHLAVASAIGYLEFRLPELLSAADCPAAKDWYNIFNQRPSMIETRPEKLSTTSG